MVKGGADGMKDRDLAVLFFLLGVMLLGLGMGQMLAMTRPRHEFSRGVLEEYR